MSERTYRVDSEVGQLRQVILHRPGLELKRLTPGNKDRLLFDDVLWVQRAQQEHDAFARALRDRGVTVHLFGELLRDTVDDPGGQGKYVLDQIFDDRVYGPMAVDALRNCFDAMDTDTLTEHLIGGITKREVLRPDPGAALGHLPRAGPGRLRAGAAAQPPLHPRHLGLDRRRGVDQQHAQDRPDAGDRALRGGLPVAPAVRRGRASSAGPTASATAWPPPRAATCWCSAAARC